MGKQGVYKLEGKSPEEVKQSFVHYMGDKNATSKQIKDAANSRYVKIDTINVVRSICKKQFGVDNIYKITDAGRISDVSDALTSLINAGGDEGEIKELKNTRSYVNKYGCPGFEVVLGGDCELETMIRALKFITKVLEEEAAEVYD